MNFVCSTARVMLATPFILSGIDAITRPQTHRARIRELFTLFEKANISLPAVKDENLDSLTRTTGVAMTLAGGTFTFAKFPYLSAFTLTALQIPVAFANHPFWNNDGQKRRQDFLALASTGGLLGGVFLAAHVAKTVSRLKRLALIGN